MTRTEMLPLDIPPSINEATGHWEQFGWYGYRATEALLSAGYSPYLRGSRMLRMVLPERRRQAFDSVRRQVRYEQRTVPRFHERTAADPDTKKPVDNQIELKLLIPPELFGPIDGVLSQALGIPSTGIMLDCPTPLSPVASDELRRSHHALGPHNRILFSKGSVPGRNMPFVSIEFQTDWIGAGSTHTTRLPLAWWRVYPTGETNDMRNRNNCTNVDGLWGRITKTRSGLGVIVPAAPDEVFLPDSAIHLHTAALTRADYQSAVNVADVLARGLRNGAALGIRYTNGAIDIASKWMEQARTIFDRHPIQPEMQRNISVSLRAAELHDRAITADFLDAVDFSPITGM